MRHVIDRFRHRLRSDTETKTDDRPPTVLYECPACRSLIIHPASDNCSQCGSAPLSRR